MRGLGIVLLVVIAVAAAMPSGGAPLQPGLTC
jgi:hypothetical protein